MAENLPVASYIPHATLLNFLGKVKETVLPPKIDSSLARNMSGGMGGALMSTLRFLGLIDANDQVTELLRNLVAAYKTDTWKEAYAGVIANAYAPIIGNLDITNTTQAMLEEQFKKNTSGSGQVLEKGIRFYTAALAETDEQVSPHLKARKARSVATRKATRKNGDTNAASGGSAATVPPVKPPTGMRVLRLQVPDKKDVEFYIPEDLTADDWTFLEPIFQAYMGRILASKPKPDAATGGG